MFAAGEYVHVDGDRCRVTIPLGSPHPTIAAALIRLDDGARLIWFRDGEWAVGYGGSQPWPAKADWCRFGPEIVQAARAGSA